MGKPWCDFFARARAVGGSSPIAPVAWVVALGSLLAFQPAIGPGFARAESTSLSPAAQTGDFLLLPAYDLEIVEDAKPSHSDRSVGDSIKLRALGSQSVRDRVVSVAKAPVAESPESISGDGFHVVAQPGAFLVTSGAAAPNTSHNPSPTPSDDVIFELALVRSGDLKLPALVLLDEAKKAQGRTRPLQLKAKSALGSAEDAEKNKPAELLPPIGLAFPIWAAVALGLVGAALMAGVIWGVLRWFKNRRPAALPKVPVPEKPEDQVALQALSELEQKGFALNSQFKKHYFGISEILKAYFARRFEVDALESTSGELVQLLEKQSKRPLDRSFLERVTALYEKLDRVKFTDFAPTGREPQLLLEEARKIVLETRIKVVAAGISATNGAKGSEARSAI